jgi:hypothetical protein
MGVRINFFWLIAVILSAIHSPISLASDRYVFPLGYDPFVPFRPARRHISDLKNRRVST